MRNLSMVILLLITLFFAPTSNLHATQVRHTTPKSQSLFNSNYKPDGFIPINYDVYNGYANGSSIFVDSRNSLDQTQIITSDTPYPFGNNMLSLGGSENLAYLSHLGFNMMQEVGTTTSFLDESLIDPGVNIDSSTNPGNVAVGDFDGDHQTDIALVYYSGDIVLTIFTHSDYYTVQLKLLSTPSYVAIAGSQFVPISNQIQQPQITAGNFDDDPMDEFAVICLDTNGDQQILLFDDLMHSHVPQAIHYGDFISLSTPVNTINGLQPTNYVQSTGTTLTYASNDVYRTANWVPNTPIASDPSMRFKIVNPNDLTSTAQLGYGFPISLQDQNGLYVSNDMGEVILSPSITDDEIFTIRDETLTTNTDRAIYELNTVGIESYTINSIRTFLGVDSSSLFEGYNPSFPNPRIQYQIHSADALMEHFQVDPLSYINPISVSGIWRLKPYTEPSEMLRGGSLNILSINVDADERSELLVTGLDSNDHPIAYIYDDSIANNVLLSSFQWNNQKKVFPNIAAGDMNADGLDELVFSYSNQSSASIEIYNHQFQLIHSITGLTPGDYPTVKTGDLDNDGKDELLYLNHGSYLNVYDDQSNAFNPIVLNYFVFNTNDVTLDDFGIFGEENTTRIQSFATSFPQMSIGDFDIDGDLEIGLNVYAHDTNVNEYYVTVIFSLDDTKLSLLDHRLENNGYIPSLISGDFESDSYIVEYTGNHTTFTTPGELSAIAVASPVQERIDQNYGESFTLFGTSVSQSSSESNEFSTSYGAFIKFELQFGIFGISIAQFETQAGFTHAMNLRSVQTSTTVITTEFHGDASDDSVIYTAAVYDMYSFTVLDSKNRNQIGKSFTLSIPNTPALYKQHKSFYNQNSGLNDQINSSIIPSTPGDLTSYMSHSELTQYVQSYATGTALESDEIQIGQGEGYNSVKIDISQEDTTGFSQSYSFDFSVSGGMFGLSLGYTFGLTSTHAYETTIGQSTSFGLDVGDIMSADDYTKYRYGFGLAVYQVDIINHGEIQSPWVINSWVTLPNTWTPPPPLPTDTNTNSGSEDANSNGFFGISFNFLFFALALVPVIIVNRRVR